MYEAGVENKLSGKETCQRPICQGTHTQARRAEQTLFPEQWFDSKSFATLEVKKLFNVKQLFSDLGLFVKFLLTFSDLFFELPSLLSDNL